MTAQPMSSEAVGTQAHNKKESLKAVYTHCCGHNLAFGHYNCLQNSCDEQCSGYHERCIFDVCEGVEEDDAVKRGSPETK